MFVDEKQDFEEPEVVPRIDKNALNQSLFLK